MAKWIQVLLGLAVVLTTAACLGLHTRDGKTISRSECEARGGYRDGMAGRACALPALDAGKACSKEGDCAGYCDAETRTCSKMDSKFGCYSFLDKNGEAVSICVD